MNTTTSVAEGFALLLSVIQHSIETGRATKPETLDAISHAIHLMFPYTDAYRAAREVWMLSLRGVVEPRPEELLRPAIDRGHLEIERLQIKDHNVVKETRRPPNGKPSGLRRYNGVTAKGA